MAEMHKMRSVCASAHTVLPARRAVNRNVGSQVECPSYVAARMCSCGGVLPRRPASRFESCIAR